MAEVKRYTASIMHPGVREDPEGLLVAYHHYAELKAEVERLTKAIDLTIIDLDERHERQDLRAWEFAELLRKAKGVQS
jgi:hypothetical protein